MKIVRLIPLAIVALPLVVLGIAATFIWDAIYAGFLIYNELSRRFK
jgi:hypothetical protein